jgi:hypothetical protein
MSTDKTTRTAAELQKQLSSLQAQRQAAALENTPGIKYSLEGLRLSGLLQQLQALQAVQGLVELRPKSKSKKNRFQIPDDPQERAAQRQWLQFKADWLEALLEDAIFELTALEKAESAARD